MMILESGLLFWGHPIHRVSDKKNSTEKYGNNSVKC